MSSSLEGEGQAALQMFALFIELANVLTDALSIASTFALSGLFPVITALVWNVNVVPVVELNATGVFETELNTMKLYVYGGVPPDSPDTVSVVNCPWSMTVLDIVSVGVVSAEFTTMFALFIELASAFVVGLSIVRTFAFIGLFPTMTAFAVNTNVVAVDDWNAITVFETELNT